MATFKQNNIQTSASLLNRQRAKPIIYVEGETDKKIFTNYWFVDILEKVTFDTVPQTTGCGAVVAKVGAERLKGISAFGIVDRDKLMADDNWPLLRELDDAAFEAARPYADVKITRRWELESYLIDPAIIESYVAAIDKGRKPRPVGDVVDDYLQHANALVPLAAINQTLHLHKSKAVGDGYSRLDDRATVDSRIRAEKIAGAQALEPDYVANTALVEKFAGDGTASPREQLEGLLRILNGKSLLDRIMRAAKIQHDPTYVLAMEIKRAGRVPEELAGFVGACCM